MIKYFLVFFLGSLALGAVAALVLPASEYLPHKRDNITKSSIYTENTFSESYEVSNPEVIQSESKVLQSDVQNRETGYDLDLTNVNTHKTDVISWEIDNNLELKRRDSGKSGIKSYTLNRKKFLKE